MEDENVNNALGHSVLPKCEFLTKQNIPLEVYQKCFSASERTARIIVLCKEKSRSVCKILTFHGGDCEECHLLGCDVM
jgi:hypothetical protein